MDGSYVQEQEEFDKPIEFSEYANQMLSDKFENWQSEFLQLIWQVAGLAFLILDLHNQKKEMKEKKKN